MTRLIGRWLLVILSLSFVATSSSFGQDEGAATHIDAESLVRQLAERCRPWLQQPGPELNSLKYRYHLGGDERVVELAPGAQRVRRGVWQGATLTTGLYALAASPDKYQATAERIEGDATNAEPFIRLTVRPKAPDRAFHLEVGNGIDGSWHGYYTHPSAEMQLDLDPETLLPMRELHQDSQYTFDKWREVKQGAWIPQMIVASRGDADYRMSFSWQGEAAWLLTHAEIVSGDRVRPVARVSDVLVNDEAIAVALSAEQQRLDAARQVVRRMLDRNAAWLAPQPSFDSLQYTFHTEKQDVTETCVVRRDGFAVIEVTGDGQGKMAAHVGNRKIVTPDNSYATASREDARAKVHESTPDRSDPDRALQLRRYALTGCQFDLPLFELRHVLDDAMVEVEDGQWNGTPCYVATITLPSRRGYLGCGVMLGFTSWSYVHHLYPAYEVIYIDKDRLVPLHETFVTSRDDRRFEINFGDFSSVDAADGRLAPLRIEISAADYFTCRYEFQIVGEKHWLLRSAESWFDPAEKSRGVVANVTLDEPSELADESERQVAAYRDVFSELDNAVAGAGATKVVETLPFKLGQPLTVGSASIVFTLDSKGQLVVRCTSDESDIEDGHPVTLLLLDDKDRLVQAGHACFAGKEGRLRAEAAFGRSYALRNVARFVVAGLGDVSTIPGAEPRQLRIVSATDGAEVMRTRGIADESGRTQIIDVALRRNDAGQPVTAIHLVSSDGPSEFEVDGSVAVFDESGRLAAAASRSHTLMVEDGIFEDSWELSLPKSFDPDEISFVAVGVSRGHTLREPFSATWITYLDPEGPFSLDALLAGEDSACWSAALDLLNRELQETLQDGLLDRLDEWRQQQAEQKRPAEQLGPRVGRLLKIVNSTREPATLAAAIRLLGFSADRRAVEPARRLLLNDDATVRDAAAIALGLLKSDAGLARIDEIIGRAELGHKDPDWRNRHYARRDALIALAAIRSDASISLVEKWMHAFVEGSEVVALDRGGSQLNGAANDAKQLAQLLGRLPDARYLPILMAALQRAEQGEDAVVPAREELLESILSYVGAAREFLEPRVRRGESATVYAIENSSDEFYVDALGAMLETSAGEAPWRPAVDYLWNCDSENAVDVMRQAFDRGVPEGKGQEATRLHLAEALAGRGDPRGLPMAFALLVDLAEPGDPPEDERLMREWQDDVDDRRDAALDVFKRAATNDVAKLLGERAKHAHGETRLALLQVLEQMRAIPAAIQPEVERWAADTSNANVSQLAERLLISRR